MTSAATAGASPASYTYSGDGQRVRRNVDGVETWQVYGFDGELLAEYAANTNVASPQKEYGYRNGQLLITADAPARTNVALAANGATASASSSYPSSQSEDDSPGTAINGERTGKVGSMLSGWNDAAPGNTFPDWLQVDFNGSKTIDEIDVVTLQDNYNSPSEPTEAMTFSLYGLTGYEVQYWNADTSAWTTVTGGSLTGNNKVWRKFSFSPVTTSKIRVLTNAAADGYSRITELEAWATPAPPPLNVAAAANGGVASASSSYPSSQSEDDSPGTAINGERTGKVGSMLSGWNDAAPSNTFPDWLQVDFNGSKTIDEIDVVTLQDNYNSPSEPTETMTFSLYGLSGFDIQYWNGSTWTTVTNGSITNNNKVWKKVTFSPITTSKIRVLTNASVDGYSRITEVEAWTASSGGSSANINWLVTDQLGTPRMVFDKTGSRATTKRHDYAPFGEELFNGLRPNTVGYYGADSTRQKFTQKERDVETGLDYFGARYYANSQGRFISFDPAPIKLKQLLNPQDLNRFTYVANNPLRFVDPTGREKIEIVVRTYIPSQTITYPPKVGATFNGNLDANGRRLPGKEGFKTEQRITIETDATKSVLVYGQPTSEVGPTRRLERGLGNILGPKDGEASGRTLKETANRDSYNTVTAHFSGNESNPLLQQSPGISHHLNISVTSDGPNSTATIHIAGTHDGFPAYQLEINRPEASMTAITQIHDPRATGDTPAALYPPEEYKVDRTFKIDPIKQH